MRVHYKMIYLLAGIQIAFMLLFSVFIYYSISNYAFTDFYKRLEIRAAITAKIELENSQDLESIQQMNQDYLEELPNQKKFLIPFAQKGQFAKEFHIPKSLIQDITKAGAGQFNEGNQLYAGILYTNSKKQKYIVIVSAENYFYTHHITYLRNLLLTTLGFGMILITLLSIFFSRTIIKPVNNIISEVQNISSENLHLRLKEGNKNDPLNNLAITFNDVLNRLETSFESQKNFISNASHELNTPLTSIRGEAELALSRDRSEAYYKDSLNKILIEAEKLERKTDALLQLAQTGFNGKTQKFEKVRIDELLLEVQEMVSRTYPDTQIQLDLSLLPEDPRKLKVNGNYRLLHVAVFNILANACKYSTGKPVQVALAASDKFVTLLIRDFGLGIPEHELAFIYDPYFRASNVTHLDGYGIGLPLTRNIVRMHKGELIVNSEENIGTTVEIRLLIGNFEF